MREDCRASSSPDGQKKCLNYFGTLAPKVKAVLVHFHTEMWKLGMSNAVMHNEVASGQHEISPIFALKNMSADQNALCQDVCSQRASTANAINVHGDTLRASIGHAGNDHRLGAQEAPLAIISLETGLSLEENLKNVVAGGSLEGHGDVATVLGEICNDVADINARFEDRKGAVHFELIVYYDDLEVTPVTNVTGGSHDECDRSVCVRFSMAV